MSINELRWRFDNMDVHGKYNFIKQLEPQIEASNNREYRLFLSDCIRQYKTEVHEAEMRSGIYQPHQKQGANFMQRKNAPGKNFLKIVSIIGFVVGGINIIGVFWGLLTAGFFNAIAPIGLGWGVYYTIIFLITGYGIFICILGIIHCTNLAKAELLENLGVISLVLIVIWTIVEISVIGPAALVLMPLNAATPILYIVGASKNKAEFKKITWGGNS